MMAHKAHEGYCSFLSWEPFEPYGPAIFTGGEDGKVFTMKLPDQGDAWRCWKPCLPDELAISSNLDTMANEIADLGLDDDEPETLMPNQDQKAINTLTHR